MGGGGEYKYILDLGTRWGWLADFMPWPFYHGKATSTQWTGGWVNPRPAWNTMEYHIVCEISLFYSVTTIGSMDTPFKGRGARASFMAHPYTYIHGHTIQWSATALSTVDGNAFHEVFQWHRGSRNVECQHNFENGMSHPSGTHYNAPFKLPIIHVALLWADWPVFNLTHERTPHNRYRSGHSQTIKGRWHHLKMNLHTAVPWLLALEYIYCMSGWFLFCLVTLYKIKYITLRGISKLGWFAND
jgi:hypothetical protein